MVKSNIIDILVKYRKCSAFISGLLLTLAFAPFNYFIAAIFSFYIFINLLYQSQDPLESFITGYLFGFGFFLSSLYWIAISLMVDISMFWWVFPFAVLGIPAALAIYIGILGVITTAFPRDKMWFTINFSVFWVAIEVLRGFVPFDFPWQFIGYTISNFDAVLWSVSYLGITLTSLVVMIIITSFAAESRGYAILMIILSAAVYYYGDMVLKKDAMLTYYKSQVRIVQPSILEHHFGDPNKRMDALAKLVNLSRDKLPANTRAVIWPEAALPYTYSGNDASYAKVLKFLPPDVYLITGIDRLDDKGNIFNSIVVFDSSSKVQKIYDKETLVPFGEYIPFRKLLGFFPKVTDGIMDFSPGLNLDQNSSQSVLDFYPLICYEVLFPFSEDIVDFKWILNVTNDAWFGNSIGPYQHFAMVKFKAAEYRKPIVRVANNGISAVIDPFGRVMESLKWNEVGYIDALIPHLKSNLVTWSLIKIQNLILLVMVLCAISGSMSARS